MGCSFVFSGSSFDSPKRRNPNPDPRKWDLVRKYERYPYLMLQVTYPNCTNYEGQKILIFRNCTYADILKQKELDPHFARSKTKVSPFMRIEPTEEGWLMGKQIINNWRSEHETQTL